MFLHSVSPTGDYTNIDMSGMPLWRLGIAARAINQPKDGLSSHVALMFTYPANVPGGVNRIVLAAVDTKAPGEAEGIAGVGLPYLDLEQNRRRLHEAAKSLFYIEAVKKEADVIATRISQLADAYHAILDALSVGKGASTSDLSAPVGIPLKGELEGWKFAVTHERFDQWRGAAPNFRPANAAIADLSALLPQAAGASAIGAPPATGVPQPPPPRAPTREEKRKAGAKAAPSAPVAPIVPAAPEVLPSAPPATPDDNEPPVLQVEDEA